MKCARVSGVCRTVLDVRWSSDKESVISSSQGIVILLPFSIYLVFRFLPKFTFFAAVIFWWSNDFYWENLDHLELVIMHLSSSPWSLLYSCKIHITVHDLLEYVEMVIMWKYYHQNHNWQFISVFGNQFFCILEVVSAFDIW